MGLANYFDLTSNWFIIWFSAGIFVVFVGCLLITCLKRIRVWWNRSRVAEEESIIQTKLESQEGYQSFNEHLSPPASQGQEIGRVGEGALEIPLEQVPDGAGPRTVTFTEADMQILVNTRSASQRQIVHKKIQRRPKPAITPWQQRVEPVRQA